MKTCKKELLKNGETENRTKKNEGKSKHIKGA